MSLLKWKELAQRKTELGKKINYVHNAITKHKIGEETSQESFGKLFKPVTSKLDDVVDSNLNLRMPQRKKRPLRKGEVPNYGIDIEDEVEDMGLGDLFEQPVLPESEKQIVPKPPTYEESLQDLMEGKKEIYVDPQYFPGNLGDPPPKDFPEEQPPEYDDDEEIDYGLDDEDKSNVILDDVGTINYENVDKILNQPEMTPQKTKLYIKKIIKEAEFRRSQLSGFKANVTKKYNKGDISEADRQVANKRIDNARVTLYEYINYYNTQLETIKGSGIKGRRRKQRGGNVMFFNDVKQLLKKLELIIGEVIAGNTSIQMRSTGVNILDTLLRMSTINRPQYNKLYNQYFKV